MTKKRRQQIEAKQKEREQLEAFEKRKLEVQSALDVMLKIGASKNEVLYGLDTTIEELNQICLELFQKTFEAVYQQGFNNFKREIRRMQFESAKGLIMPLKEVDEKGKEKIVGYKVIVKPSVEMRKFLGEVYLGQGKVLEEELEYEDIRAEFYNDIEEK